VAHVALRSPTDHDLVIVFVRAVVTLRDDEIAGYHCGFRTIVNAGIGAS